MLETVCLSWILILLIIELLEKSFELKKTSFFKLSGGKAGLVGNALVS